MWELIVRLLQCPDTYLLSHCFWICLLYLKKLSSHWIPSALQYLRTMPSNLCLPPKTQLMHFVTAATWDKTMHSASHSCRVWTHSLGHGMEKQGVPEGALEVSAGSKAGMTWGVGDYHSLGLERNSHVQSRDFVLKDDYGHSPLQPTQTKEEPLYKTNSGKVLPGVGSREFGGGFHEESSGTVPCPTWILPASAKMAPQLARGEQSISPAGSVSGKI